jgi:hypothetical protein
MWKNEGDYKMRGIVNIVIGAIFIIGGLSGGLVLIGTESGLLLALVGVLLVGLGIFRMVSSRNR